MNIKNIESSEPHFQGTSDFQPDVKSKQRKVFFVIYHDAIYKTNNKTNLWNIYFVTKFMSFCVWKKSEGT